MIRQLGVASRRMTQHPVLRAEILAAYPSARLYDGNTTLSENALIAWLQGCDAAIVGLEPITDNVLSALPDLKLIAKFGVGCDTIDFDALLRHQVRFGFTPGVNRLSVAELALCFMIAGLRHITPLNQAMRAGARPSLKVGRHLSGRIVGIHGCGNIGKKVVMLLKPFNCHIFACDIADYSEFYATHGVTAVDFATLLAESEVLTLHLPLTEKTSGLYDATVLAKLRSDCVLINTCRGGIVDENALAACLESGALLAACFDVFAVEPAINDRLLKLPNFLATPHIGAAAEEARLDMGRAALRGLTENRLLAAGERF